MVVQKVVRIVKYSFLFFFLPWLLLTLSLYPLVSKGVYGEDRSILWLYVPASPLLFVLWVFMDWFGMKMFRHN